jgi:hypothetical protein
VIATEQAAPAGTGAPGPVDMRGDDGFALPFLLLMALAVWLGWWLSGQDERR